MKNYDKSYISFLRALIAAFIFLIGYITVMLIIVYVASHKLSNDVEEMYIEYGYEQGRRQVLDSLNTTYYETEKFNR